MELVKHTNSVNFYSNIEKNKDQSWKGGIRLCVLTQLFFKG